MYDILIKNGTVVDGGGERPAFRADIGIRNKNITDIGNLAGSTADTVIDADSKVVCPGFIDIQNHSDVYGALFADASLKSLLRQGITTALMGQCGSSLAPLLKGSLFSIRKWVNVSGVNVGWKSMREFLAFVKNKNLGINIATLVGHATLRRDFVGDEARALTKKEAAQLEHLYEKSVKQGAWGLSVGLEYSHDRVSDEQELSELLTWTAKQKGVASFHLRNEGVGIESSLSEVLFIAQSTGVRTKISHFKIRNETSSDRAKKILKTIDKAQQEGIEIFFDVYPYTVGALVLYLLLPEWATEGGRGALLEKLSHQQMRKEIKEEMKKENYSYDNIRIASSAVDRTLSGKTIAQLAGNQNTSPEEVILNLIQASQDQTIVFVENTTEEILSLFLQHPACMIATDGSGWGRETQKNSGGRLVHPRSFGTTARILGKYVREKKILSLEDAVYKLSGLPAQFLGLTDRGMLTEGNIADIVIFDPHTITDQATFKNPYQYPSGISHVIVNGSLSVKNERSMHTTAGQVLAK